MSHMPSLKGNSHPLEEIWTNTRTEVCRAARTKKCTRKRRETARRPWNRTVGASELGAKGDGTGMTVETEIGGVFASSFHS